MFKGTGTALITPFNSDGSIDFDSLKKLIADQVQNGVEALIVLGTTGEAPVLDDNERRAIIETVIAEAAGKARIIVGTGANDTKYVVYLSKMAEELNADGVLVVNPYYNKSTQAGLVEHFKHVCGSVSLPVILYNVPSRTSMNMLPETVLRIHEACPNVTAVKEASGDLSQIARLLAMKPASLSVLSGNDDQTLPLMAIGADGVISVFSNVFPAVMKQIVDFALREDYKSALKLHNMYINMMNLLFMETNPMPVKYACSLRGLCENTLRLPLITVQKATKDAIKDEMNRLMEITI